MTGTQNTASRGMTARNCLHKLQGDELLDAVESTSSGIASGTLGSVEKSAKSTDSIGYTGPTSGKDVLEAVRSACDLTPESVRSSARPPVTASSSQGVTLSVQQLPTACGDGDTPGQHCSDGLVGVEECHSWPLPPCRSAAPLLSESVSIPSGITVAMGSSRNSLVPINPDELSPEALAQQPFVSCNPLSMNARHSSDTREVLVSSDSSACPRVRVEQNDHGQMSHFVLSQMTLQADEAMASKSSEGSQTDGDVSTGGLPAKSARSASPTTSVCWQGDPTTLDGVEYDIHSVDSSTSSPRSVVRLETEINPDQDNTADLRPRRPWHLEVTNDPEIRRSKCIEDVKLMFKSNGGVCCMWPQLLCMSCFIIYCIAHGTRFASGELYAKFVQRPCTPNDTDSARCGGFGASASTAAWIFSLYSGLIQGLAPLASRLIKRYGCQFVALLGAAMLGVSYLTTSFMDFQGLFYTYGVFGGTGACLLYNSSILMIGSYFLERRTLANGLALSGAGFGGVLITYIAQSTLASSSWRIFYRYMAVACLPLMLATFVMNPRDTQPGRVYIRRHSTYHLSSQAKRAAAMRARNRRHSRDSLLTAAVASTGAGGTQDSGRTPPDQTVKQLRRLIVDTIKEKRSRARPRFFSIMATAFLLSDAVIFNPYFFIPDIPGLTRVKVTYSQCASLGVGAVVMALVGSRPKHNPCLLQALCFTCLGVICLLPILSGSAESYITFCVIYGFFNGAAWSLFVPTMVVIVGSKHVRHYIGIVFFVGMIGTITGPPVAGAILDSTENHGKVFLFSMILLLAGAVLLVTNYLGLKWQAKYERSLMHKTHLATMMRDLSKQTSQRPRKPPLMRRKTTLQHFKAFGASAVGVLHMPFAGELYGSSQPGPMEDFSTDWFQDATDLTDIVSILETTDAERPGLVAVTNQNSLMSDDQKRMHDTINEIPEVGTHTEL